MDENGEKDLERWQQIERIYHDAQMLELSERSAFVAQACGDDPALFEEVMSLLAADDSDADFLRETAVPLGLEILAGTELGSTEDTLDRTQPAPIDCMLGMLVNGRYTVTEKLGGGGMGDVYIAFDKPEMAHRRVVIKVLKEARLRDEWIVNKFKQEAEALTKINAPGVVGILDAGTLLDGKPYLVMQYVEGEALRCYCKRKQERQKDIELEEVAEIIKQIGQTLDVAHKAGIIHRDLTPDNIIIHRNASGLLQATVIDFGIAKVKNSVLAPSTQTVHLAGTWQYMSPEQLQRETATPRSDIYALGVIAYEMLTGRRPFHARTPIHLAELQRRGVKVMPQDLRPGDLSDSAQRAILRALSYNPTKRHQDALEFGDDLSRALTEIAEETVLHTPAVDTETPTPEKAIGEAVAHVKTPATRLAPLTSKRRFPFLRISHRWRIAAVSVFLVCLIGFALWYIFQKGYKPPQVTQSAKSSSPETLGPERSLTYWFMVSSLKQPGMRPSLGTETFFTKEEFDIVAKPAQTGWLYLISRGKDVSGNTALITLFPTRSSSNNWDARLEADQERRIKGAWFSGKRGQEEIFIVWSVRPIDWLEQVVKESEGDKNSNNRYRLTEAGRNRWQNFLDTTTLTESIEDEEQSLLTLKGRGDILVSVRRLKHADPP